MKPNHKVTLVGAGPGDAELLTVKAVRAIESASIVVYDRLVSDEILALIPHGVPKIYAGKSCVHKAMPQEEINQLLITLAKKYYHVVRLKGGDPFLFGRGGEEMQALQSAGIICDIIPGITSAQGCAAASGIPLTHRDLASSVRYITGHYNNEIKSQLPLSLVSADETLVVYMGIFNSGEITRQLLAAGLAEDTPAAIIERGTMPEQRVLVTVLAQLPHVIDVQGVTSPALLIIGKVAALAENQNLLQNTLQKYATMAVK